MVSPARLSVSSAVSFMWWLTRLSWMKWFVFVCMLGFLSIFAIFARLHLHACSFQDTVRAVQEVCDLYHAGMISGPMCSSLCDHAQFSYSYCGSDFESQKTVLIMDCNDCGLGDGVDKLVLKMAVNTTEWQTTADKILQHPYSFEKAIERLSRLLKNRAVTYMGGDNVDDLLVMCFGDLRSSSLEADLAMVRSVVAIVLQNEYVKMISLKKHGITPDIYGYCGQAYFMEYTPPLVEAGYVFPLRIDNAPQLYQYRIGMRPWSDRARLAIDIIQTMRRLDSLSKPLDILDIKTRNVGINYKNRPVLLDLDYSVYRTSYERPCKDDAHCGSGIGFCNTTTHRCARIDNNLNRACKELLTFTAILAFPPWSVRGKLSEAIQQCIHPSEYYNTPNLNRAGPDIADKLEAILKRSLEE